MKKVTNIDNLLIEIDYIEAKIITARRDYVRAKNAVARYYYKYKMSCVELDTLKVLFSDECNKIK